MKNPRNAKSAAGTKVLFIEARKKGSAFDAEFKEFAENAAKYLGMLPHSFTIAYSVQYKALAEMLKRFFEKNGKKIKGCVQVLGCSLLGTKEKNILLIGSGEFHALQLALQAKNVFIYEDADIRHLDKKEIDNIILSKKVALSKFLSAETIGILASSKPGQGNLSLALSLKRKLEKMGRQAFVFFSDNVNANEFENFRIDCWVNTACPGIATYNNNAGRNVINYNDILSLI